MKYLALWVVVITICHFVMCGLAAFLNWDASYFWIGSWNGLGRFIYVVVLIIATAVVAVFANEEINE